MLSTETIILIALACALAYFFFVKKSESFSELFGNLNKQPNPQKECSDTAVSKEILDYQLSPLNQLKTPK
jgi:hypothetical protein